ncbi:MAG TPA: VCBS repeat-containing protein [Acidimicrobiia bacterium]
MASSLGGNYQPIAGDFDGDGRDDVFLYAPGTAQDYVAYANASRGSFTKVPVAVNGSYRPFVGDFNGDGISDVFWYGPGDAPDWIWYGHSNRTFTTRMMSISGDYQPTAGDFNCDGRTDIVWASYPFGGHSFIWTAAGNTEWRWAGVSIPPHAIMRAADFNGDACDDLVVDAPGADEILFGSPFHGFSVHPTSGPYVASTPIAGNFEGSNDRNYRGDVLWYAQHGSYSEAWYSRFPTFTFQRGYGSIQGLYRPVAGDFDGDGQTDILWLNPASTISPIWFDVRRDLIATDGAKWARDVGTAQDDQFQGVAAAPDGGWYAVGEVHGFFDDDARPHTATDFDAIVVRYAPDGTEVWRRDFGSSADDDAVAVAVDGQGNVHVIGSTAGHIPGAPETTHPGMFETEFTPSGTMRWIHQTADWGPAAIAVDAAGNSYVTGSQSTGNGFLIAFNSSGGEVWRHDNLNVSWLCAGVGISHNRQVVVGSLGQLMSYTTAGALQWSETLNLSQNEGICGLTVDRFGNIDVTGFTQHHLPLPAAPYAGGIDAFVMQLSGSGTPWFVQRIGGSGDDFGRAVTVDHGGDMIITGDTTSTLTPNNNPRIVGFDGSAGGADVFVDKQPPIDVTGQLDQFGGAEDEYGYGVATSPDGHHIAAVGQTDSPQLPLAPTAYVGGYGDAFIVNY